MNREQRLRELRTRREQSLAGGGPERVAKIHARGGLTARERLTLLLDPPVDLGIFMDRIAHHPRDDQVLCR